VSNIEDVREDFLALWSRLGPLWGISPSTAKIHAWLLSERVGADAETLAESLSLSRGAVSMGCRELVDWGLVTAGRPSGSRRVIFKAEQDLERAIVAIVQTRKRREWDPLLASVRDWQERLEDDTSEEADQMRQVFGEMEGVVRMVGGTARAFLEGFVIRRIGLKAILKAARRKEK